MGKGKQAVHVEDHPIVRVSGPHSRLRRGLAIAAVAVVCGWAPAAAQDALDPPETRPSEPIPVDSLPVDSLAVGRADTVAVLAPRFVESAGREELARVPSEDVLPRNPRNAAIRSFLLPGWGQIYTGHPWRALLFGGGEVVFFALGYRKQLEALDKKDELQAEKEAFFATLPDSVLADTLEAERLFDATEPAVAIRSDLAEIEDRRQDWYAYFAASVIFAAVDAYVAAQLDPIRVRTERVRGRFRAGLELPVGAAPRRDRGP